MQFKLLAISLTLGATALLGACSTEGTTTDPAVQPDSPTELQSPAGNGVTVPESPTGLDESPAGTIPDTTSPAAPDSTLESPGLESPGAIDPVDPTTPGTTDSSSPDASTLESPAGTPAN